MLSVAVSLIGGLLFGYLFLDTGVKDTLDLILMSALDIMIFIAGSNKIYQPACRNVLLH